jgi:glycosyltransferase involved in cell wall biosynthesis
MPEVSVLICVRNDEKHIEYCISSILNQNFIDFEIILIDDMSTDNTAGIVSKFRDNRIKYFKNSNWLGIPKSRNKALKFASGQYLFFTDSDCRVAPNWIREGLIFLRDEAYLGVEGRIVYVSEDYTPSFSERVMENTSGGRYMTGNIAFKKETLTMVGTFNECLNSQSDREMGLRVLRQGKIYFNKNMIVFHPRVILAPKNFLKNAVNMGNRIILFKRFGDRELITWRIVAPLNLAKFFFPPLVFVSLFRGKLRIKNDYRVFSYMYLYIVLERINVWKISAREKAFVI